MPERSDASWEQLVVKLGTNELTQPRVVTVEFSDIGQVEVTANDVAIPPTVSVSGGRIRAATAEGRDHSGPSRTLQAKLGRQLAELHR